MSTPARPTTLAEKTEYLLLSLIMHGHPYLGESRENYYKRIETLETILVKFRTKKACCVTAKDELKKICHSINLLVHVFKALYKNMQHGSIWAPVYSDQADSLDKLSKLVHHAASIPL